MPSTVQYNQLPTATASQCPILTQHTASLSRNAQFSQLDLGRLFFCRYFGSITFLKKQQIDAFCRKNPYSLGEGKTNCGILCILGSTGKVDDMLLHL